MVFSRKPTYIPAGSTAPRSDIPAGLWNKCKACKQVIYQSALETNLNVCSHCGYHYPMTILQRLQQLTDPDSFREINAEIKSCDPINFAGNHSYEKKIAETMQETGLAEAICTGIAQLEKIEYALGIMDFRFFGASMGSAVGEKVTRLVELATAEKKALVIVVASGGARMQEGILSLMQMAKTSGALMRHDIAGLPFIAILTHPTTGGVTASFASLGDIILAEPKALIGFAGPRVVKQTTQAAFPEGFQSAEFLLEHGFIDRVVERKELRRELAKLLRYFEACYAV